MSEQQRFQPGDRVSLGRSDDGSVELTREHLATPTGRTNQ